MQHTSPSQTQDTSKKPSNSLIKLAYSEKYGWLEIKDSEITKEDYERVRGIEIEVSKPFYVGATLVKFIPVGKPIN